MGWVVINGDTLEFVGKYRDYSDVTVVEGSILKARHEPAIVCHVDTLADWSQLTQMEAGLLCKNAHIPFSLGNYAQTLAAIRQFAIDMEYSTITPEQIELFNRDADKLKNKYPDSNSPSTQPREALTPSKPKAPTQSRPPSSKGATGRVWVIADDQYHEMGLDGDEIRIKELRARVIKACVEAGIHEATAATQWSKWKKDRGL